VLVLALDTASAATAVAVGETGDGPGGVVEGAITVLAERSEAAGNRHVELLTPMIADALAAAGTKPGDLGLIVAGVGPGPFTGLRVGLVTAISLAQTLGIEAVGAGSLDAVAFAAPHRPWVEGFAVLGDARRREVYWARYADGRRATEPAVARPADIAGLPLHVTGAGALVHRESLPVGTEVDESAPYPSAPALLRLGTDPAWRLPLRPLYLRRPDATPPGRPKPVTPP